MKQFWLNEGFTVYLERKILSRLHGEKKRHLSAMNGAKALIDSIKQYGETHEFTKLIPKI